MSFPKQAVLATAVVAGCVGGLYFLGQGGEAEEPRAAVTEPGVAPEEKAAQPAEPEPTGPLSDAQKARDLVPPAAWLVADFKGDLTGQKPFAGAPGLCASVPAPERVVMAVLPPKAGTEPDLLIAARKVEDAFWGCARDMIVRAGGTALAQNDRYEVLKSPSGVVARGPEGSLVFLTSEGHLEKGLSVLSDLEPGAGSTGEHARLYARMQGKEAGALDAAGEDSVLDLTLALPEDWLSSVGQEKEKTPLRFISSAFVSARVDGSAQGGIDCVEAGCAEVLQFLQRARVDLSGQLPPTTASAIEQALSMEHVKGTGRIVVRWTPSEVSLGSLLGGFLGATPLGK